MVMKSLFKWRILFCLTSILSLEGLVANENFLLIEGQSGDEVLSIGESLNERFVPGCSFSIALSLMGFDSGILLDENTPQWPFKEGYVDRLEAWKASQTPMSWMKVSAVWYSRLLIEKLGVERFKFYLDAFNYGNQDISGGITTASATSLKISLKEQVKFVQKMLRGELPVSDYSINLTRCILFKEYLENDWKLYGKTGLARIDEKHSIGWFVGWIEKEGLVFSFAYQINGEDLDPSMRIPRVKQLIDESGIYSCR